LAREQLADSQLLIVNHALFFADLALREAGYGILPAYERVIFDEAHHLEDVAASSFAVNMDYAKIRNYSLMVVSPNTKFGQALKTHPTLYHEVSAVRKEVEEKAAEFFAYLNSFCVDNYAKTYSQKQLEADDLSEGLKRLNQLLKRQELPDILQLDDEARMELENLINSGQVLLNELEFLLASSSGNHVYWAEKHHVSDLPNLKASPIELGELLGDKLFSEVPGFFTSATLSISGSFDFIANRLGISSYQEGICCSPFRFEEQALLYIPQKGVSPKESSYNDYLVECCRDLLDCAGGKAFILFTSYFSLQYCSLKLGEWLEHKGFSPLIQSKGTSPYRLVEEFKTLDNPVLFGTSSFWEGVDVPGDQLSMVVITKLPFMVPTHPLENARITRLEQGGGNGFTQYSLPKAVVRFKQGFGRLIRTKHDKGVVAVLDTRVKSTWYGKHFLRSLPAVDCTDRLERVSSFLNN
jgi:ATP-dependent DNA helicase DinG